MTKLAYKTKGVNHTKTARVYPFTFTGKERDSETGFSYFGARYYDSDLSGLFLSVDPMSDKYPSVSPYAYCAWNPVKLIDPDGREIWIGEHNSKCPSRYDPNNKYEKGTIGYYLNRIHNGSKAGKYVIDALNEKGTKYFISDSQYPDGSDNPCFDNISGQIYLNSKTNKKNEGTISHELFHAFQHKNKQYGQSLDCEVEAYIFEGIVLTQMNNGVLPNSNQMPLGMKNAFSPINRYDKDNMKWYNSFVSLIYGFDEGKMNNVVNNFSKFSLGGERYASKGYAPTWNNKQYSAENSLINAHKSNLY